MGGLGLNVAEHNDMTMQPDATEEEELPEFADEGTWYRYRCTECDNITDTEEDLRGNIVVCEACGCRGRVRS